MFIQNNFNMLKKMCCSDRLTLRVFPAERIDSMRAECKSKDGGAISGVGLEGRGGKAGASGARDNGGGGSGGEGSGSGAPGKSNY